MGRYTNFVWTESSADRRMVSTCWKCAYVLMRRRERVKSLVFPLSLFSLFYIYSTFIVFLWFYLSCPTWYLLLILSFYSSNTFYFLFFISHFLFFIFCLILSIFVFILFSAFKFIFLQVQEFYLWNGLAISKKK